MHIYGNLPKISISIYALHPLRNFRAKPVLFSQLPFRACAPNAILTKYYKFEYKRILYRFNF